MSIQHMRRRFAIQLRYVLWAIILAFVVGLPLVFVPGRIFGTNEEEQRGQTPSEQVTALVNGEPVTQADVTYAFNRMVSERLPFLLQTGQGIGIGQLWMLRYQAMEEAIQRRLLLDAAGQQGISVSKGDVKKQAQQMVDQEIAQLKGQYQGPQLEQVFARIAAQQGEARPRETMSERQFARWAMTRYLEKNSGLQSDLILQRIQQAVAAQVSTNEQDLLQSFDKATVHHIVVMLHPTGKPARTDEEARKRADQLVAQIKGGADFVAVAKAESDDPGAKLSGGLMADIGRGRMAPEWDKAVFALRPGEVSGPIKLAWGYEIVRIDKLTRQFPPDFEKNKQQLLKSLTDQRRSEAWGRFVTDLRQKAKVEPRDSEMRAYQALAKGKSDEALVKLDEAKTEARDAGKLQAASVFYELGTLLAGKKQWPEASNAFQEAADALSSEETPLLPGGRAEALMAMANAEEQQGNNEDAVTWYQAAGEATESPMVHEQLLTVFQKLNRPDLVKQEQQWKADYEQQQRERQAQLEAQRKEAEAKAKGAPTAVPAQPQPAPGRTGPQPAPAQPAPKPR